MGNLTLPAPTAPDFLPHGKHLTFTQVDDNRHQHITERIGALCQPKATALYRTQGTCPIAASKAPALCGR